MLKKTITALSLLCILAACQSDDNSSPQPKPRKDIALTRAEQEMMDLGTDFAFRFFNQVCKTEVEKPNLFISPLSASLCLSMIANGALGNTLSEMTDVLGFSGYSLEEMNNYNKKLVEALLDLDNTTQLGIANSIWIKKGFGVHDDFVSVNKKMYDAQVQELDFALPHWVTMLEPGHWLQTQIYAAAMQLAERVSRMKDLPTGTDAPALECDAVQRSAVAGADLAAGSVRVSVELKPEIFYQVLSEQTGLEIGDEAGLMPCILSLAKASRELRRDVETRRKELKIIQDTCGEDAEACKLGYLRVLDLNAALAEHLRLQDNREKLRRAEAERQAAERARAAAPVIIPPTEEERQLKAEAEQSAQRNAFITASGRLDCEVLQRFAAPAQPEAPARKQYRFWVEFTREDIAWFKQGAAERGFRYGSIK